MWHEAVLSDVMHANLAGIDASTHTCPMRLRARLLRLLTIFAFLLGMQAAVFPLMAAADIKPGAPVPASHCEDCSKGMPAAQCAAVCVFALLPSSAPVSIIPLIDPKLRPALAAIPAGWSAPPETAPPRS
jgi:hypothetical protein